MPKLKKPLAKIKMTFSHHKKFSDKLFKIRKYVGIRAIRRALRSLSQEARTIIKRNTPIDTFTLKRHVIYAVKKMATQTSVGLAGGDKQAKTIVFRRFKKKKKNGVLQTLFNVNKKSKTTSLLKPLVKVPRRYFHLVNYGTKARKTKSGANRGRMPAFHMKEKADAVVLPKASQTLAETLDQEIARLN